MLETNDQINSLLRFLVYIAHLSRLSTAYYVFLKLNQYALFNQYELKGVLEALQGISLFDWFPVLYTVADSVRFHEFIICTYLSYI